MPNAPINTGRAADLKVMTLHDLFNMPDEEHRWVVDGMLPVAGSGIFHSKPKDGKSTIARQLAVSVTQGRPFLGRNTLQGPVLYLALEEKLSEVAKHFKLLGAEVTDPIYVITDCRGHNLHAIQEIITEKKPVLMIVDTLAKFVDLRKISEYGSVNDNLRPSRERYTCAVRSPLEEGERGRLNGQHAWVNRVGWWSGYHHRVAEDTRRQGHLDIPEVREPDGRHHSDVRCRDSFGVARFYNESGG
jgi:hypothetical protein